MLQELKIKKKIIKLLYEKEKLTKKDLAEKLSLSMPTINLFVSELINNGFATKKSTNISSGGRIPDYICFKYDSYYTIGIEISKNYIKILLLDMKPKIIDKQYISIPFIVDLKYWEDLKECINKIIIKNNIPSDKIIGVGIAIPGVVKHNQQVVEFAPTLRLKNFNFSKLKEILGYEVFVENEANAAGFAEVWSRKSTEDAVFLSITKSVGGAIISSNEIIYGSDFKSGEFGHMVLMPYGNICSCGKSGCFEAYCSTNVLSSHCKGNLDDFFIKIENDKYLQSVFENYMDFLAIGISNISLALDLPVILGGEINQYIEKYFEFIQQKVNSLIPYSSKKKVLSLSKTGENASAIGVALKIITNYLESILYSQLA